MKTRTAKEKPELAKFVAMMEEAHVAPEPSLDKQEENFLSGKSTAGNFEAKRT